MLSLNANELIVLALIQLLLLIVIFFIFVFFLKKVKHKKKIALLGVLFINYIVIPFITGSHQQLITDEQMLAHFKAHRHEIEILMNDYLTNPEEWGNFKSASPELKRMQLNASIERMAYKTISWHDDPYSLEASKNFSAGILSGKINTNLDKSTIDVYVSMALKGTRVFYKGKTAYKEFLYIPQVAKVEGGKLIYPINDAAPKYINFRVISKALDQVPDWLLPGDCTMKRIDDHWFLSLCLTA